MHAFKSPLARLLSLVPLFDRCIVEVPPKTSYVSSFDRRRKASEKLSRIERAVIVTLTCKCRHCVHRISDQNHLCSASRLNFHSLIRSEGKGKAAASS